MADQHIVPFPTMDSAIDAIRLFAEQNGLTPCALIDIVIEGTLPKQAEGADMTPITIFKGRSDAPYAGPDYWWLPNCGARA